MKKKKSVLVAMLLSAFILPGIGQIYVKKIKKGIILIVTFIVIFVLMMIPVFSGYINFIKSSINTGNTQISTIDLKIFGTPNSKLSMLVFFIWLLGIFDAYLSTKKYNSTIEKTGNQTTVQE